MSRSRKKNPVQSDYNRNYTAFAKRQAVKIVRNYTRTIPDGCSFKKLYCSWNIFDYKSHWFISDIKEYNYFDIEDYNKAFRK